MDDYQKLAEVEILETIESLKKEPISVFSELSEPSRIEALHSDISENISSGRTELECEREVCFTTSQKNHTEKCNSISDFPISSCSSIKAEDTNYEKTIMHKYGIHIVDNVCENELNKVDPLMLPDTKPDSIENINMVQHLIVCKSEAEEGDDTFNWEESKFDIGEEDESSLVESVYIKEEVEEYHDEEIPTIKTEERNMMNLPDLDLSYPVKDEDTDSRKEGHLVIPDLTRNSDKRSDITCAVEIVGGDLKTQHINEISLRKSAASIKHKYRNITNWKEKYDIQKESMYPFNCAHCGKSFRNKVHLTCHIKSHDELIVLKFNQCPQRKKTLTKRSDLKTHSKIHKGYRPYECPQCNMRFTKSGNLKIHLRIHEDIRPHECPQCNKRFSQSGNLKRHLRIHEGIRPYECSRCNKRFSQKVHFKSHMRYHEGIRPYECPQCNMRFTISGTLKKHLRSHEGICPYGCSQCNKRFTESRTLINHLRIHEGIRPYGCPQCNKRYTSSGDLKRHLKIHEGVHPYGCPQCNKTFTENSILKRHLGSHEGIRPYECSRCNKRFSQKGHLKSHMRYHEGIRPHECSQCKKRFTESSSLKRHLRSHEGIRPYGCPQCNKRFTQSTNLKIHLRTH